MEIGDLKGCHSSVQFSIFILVFWSQLEAIQFLDKFQAGRSKLNN